MTTRQRIKNEQRKELALCILGAALVIATATLLVIAVI